MGTVQAPSCLFFFFFPLVHDILGWGLHRRHLHGAYGHGRAQEAGWREGISAAAVHSFKTAENESGMVWIWVGKAAVVDSPSWTDHLWEKGVSGVGA